MHVLGVPPYMYRPGASLGLNLSDNAVPASAGACLWQAAPGNAYPSLPGNAHPILLGNAYPIFARHNKDKTTIPFRHS